MVNARSRAWAFTVFADENGVADEALAESVYVDLQGVGAVAYFVAGVELCPATQRSHLQCYVKFENQCRFQSLKDVLPTAHIEAAAGTAFQNRTYCTKEGRYIEKGACPTQGKRKDIDELKDAIMAGKTKFEIVEEGEVSLTTTLNMYDKLAAVIAKGKMRGSFRSMDNKFYYGDSGTGKTKLALEEGGDSVFKADLANKGWYDGYDGEKTLIIDDFDALAGKAIGVQFLKQLLDGHPLTLNIKGASTVAQFTSVIITSNHSFRECMPGVEQEDLEALSRRIGTCLHFVKGSSGPTAGSLI